MELLINLHCRSIGVRSRDGQLEHRGIDGHGEDFAATTVSGKVCAIGGLNSAGYQAIVKNTSGLNS